MGQIALWNGRRPNKTDALVIPIEGDIIGQLFLISGKGLPNPFAKPMDKC